MRFRQRARFEFPVDCTSGTCRSAVLFNVAAAASDRTWPIRRVTFQQPTTGWQMDSTMAEHLFPRQRRPGDRFSAARRSTGVAELGHDQRQWHTDAARPQWTGDYSWIVSVVPTTNAARDGMARNPEGFAYDVSVVVFYKRVLPDDADRNRHRIEQPNELSNTHRCKTNGPCERRLFRRD